jgi:hypothetical protein
VAFKGDTLSSTNQVVPGLYRSDNAGPLSGIADTNTNIPSGTGKFRIFGDPSLISTDAYFVGLGSSNQSGVYLHSAGSLTRLFDNNTNEPNGPGKVQLYSLVSAETGGLAFTARSTTTGRDGVYKYVGTSLSLVADLNPGNGSPFSFLDSVDYENGSVVFSDDQISTVFTDARGTLEKVLGPGDVLDGTVVREAHFWTGGRDGNTIAISVIFQDDSVQIPHRAIYYATIPAPPAIGALGAALLFARRLRR